VTSREQLTAAVIDCLRMSCAHPRDAVATIVHYEINSLESVISDEPSFGRQSENKNYGKEIKGLTQKLLRKIEGAPIGTRRSLSVFSAYSGLQLPRPEQLDWELIERYEETLRSSLQALREGASKMQEHRIGDYHTLDRTKHFCAANAFDLIVGLEAGEPTNGDPFRFISNTLYEIVAPDESRKWRKDHEGEPPDLRSQCEKILGNWRRDPAHVQRHAERLKRSFAGMIAAAASP